MNKVTQSILLATVLAASGFASAQNPTSPATRAEVKSEIGTTDSKPGTGNTAAVPGMTGPATQGNTSGVTRAEVKSEIGTTDRKPGTGNTAAVPGMSGATQGNMSGATRAEVKSEAINSTPRKVGTGDTEATRPAVASAERKKMRDEKRAMAKAKRDAAKMMPAPVTN